MYVNAYPRKYTPVSRRSLFPFYSLWLKPRVTILLVWARRALETVRIDLGRLEERESNARGEYRDTAAAGSLKLVAQG